MAISSDISCFLISCSSGGFKGNILLYKKSTSVITEQAH